MPLRGARFRAWSLRDWPTSRPPSGPPLAQNRTATTTARPALRARLSQHHAQRCALGYSVRLRRRSGSLNTRTTTANRAPRLVRKVATRSRSTLPARAMPCSISSVVDVVALGGWRGVFMVSVSESLTIRHVRHSSVPNCAPKLHGRRQLSYTVFLYSIHF